MKKLLPSLLVALLAGCVSPPPAELPQRRASQPEGAPAGHLLPTFASPAARPPSRSNASIAADFLELSFRMESGRSLPVFTRYETPITVATTGAVSQSAAADLAALLARLRREAQIDISRHASPATPASITVEFLPRAELQAMVPHAACFVVPRVSSWAEFRSLRGSRQIDWTTLTERSRATVFIPSDVSPQEQRDCLHEELAQALGPLNDLYHLSDSVFNDDNFNTVLTGFDMLVLRATYAPELHSGLDRAEVARRLPALLARLNPAGGSGGIAPPIVTPRAWTRAIEAALAPRSAVSTRREAALEALSLARAAGWQDNRRAFSHFVAGRLTLASDPETGLANLAEARALYARLPGGTVHLAHVDMQLAAYALNTGQPERVADFARRAAPVLRREQNAAVLAMLMFLQAEAADTSGRRAEAAAIRLDSQPWARYGFGSEAQVQARMAQVSSLTKPTPSARN